MELIKSKYSISKETLEEVLETLENNWFSCNGEHNNDDIISAEASLRGEILETDKESGEKSTVISAEKPFDFDSLPILEKCYWELSGVIKDLEKSGYDDVCKETLYRIQHNIGIMNRRIK